MKILILIPMLLALAFPVFAESASPIHVVDAKARPTATGMSTGVVYMVVMNHSQTDDTITGLSTPIADKAEMHRTSNEAGVMRMDPVAELPIKANDAVTFAPNGLHVMLTGLHQPLKLGDSFPLTLNLAKAGAVTVTVDVAAIKGPSKPMADMPGMKM